ncbi:hypothetical protein HMPREF1861_01780 [Corynebacterium kroppenstedtii]|nr:hypothetical protein HMPREF1861_01780 [Corynebacterium kroppenstedtii]
MIEFISAPRVKKWTIIQRLFGTNGCARARTMMAASHKLTGRDARRCHDFADVFEDDDSRGRPEAGP